MFRALDQWSTRQKPRKQFRHVMCIPSPTLSAILCLLMLFPLSWYPKTVSALPTAVLLSAAPALWCSEESERVMRRHERYDSTTAKSRTSHIVVVASNLQSSCTLQVFAVETSFFVSCTQSLSFSSRASATSSMNEATSSLLPKVPSKLERSTVGPRETGCRGI